MIDAPVRHFGSAQVAHHQSDGAIAIVDVRRPAEFSSGHIVGSSNIPLSRLQSSTLLRGPVLLAVPKRWTEPAGSEAPQGSWASRSSWWPWGRTRRLVADCGI